MKRFISECDGRVSAVHWLLGDANTEGLTVAFGWWFENVSVPSTL